MRVLARPAANRSQLIAMSQTDTAVRCPSAQPGMEDLQVLGVVSGWGEDARVAYVNTYVPAGDDVLASTAPLPPAQVLRLAAKCEEKRCTHFDGADCKLASRIVASLAPVSEKLPPCAIRPTCRWHIQEGAAACYRCPQIVTNEADRTEKMKAVALGDAERAIRSVAAVGAPPAPGAAL
jgi:hypothetical protein